MESLDKVSQLSFAFSGDDIKDPVILKVAEGGYEAVAFVKGVLIDSQDHWAKHADAFAGLARSELVIDAGHSGRTEFEERSEIGGRDAVVVVFVDFRPEGLGAVATRQSSLKLWNKDFKAL